MPKLNVKLDPNAKSGPLPLAGQDIMPVPYEKRTVTPRDIIAIWFAMAIELTIFIQSAEEFATMHVWEIIVACVIGHTLLFLVMIPTQDIGIRYGIPYSVSLRPSFGYIGTLIPTYLRAIPAMFWFGYQTWVAATAINQVSVILFGFDREWVWILVFGAVQILHTMLGIKAVTNLSWVALPMLLAVGAYMLYLMFTGGYGVTLANIWTKVGNGEGSYTIPGAIMAYIGGWATMALSIMDITRDCKVTEQESNSFITTTKKFFPAQWIGLVPAATLFAFIGVVGAATTGETNPVDILVALTGDQNPAVLVIALLFIVIATWCTNDTGNLYPAAYAITSTFPKKVTFPIAVAIAGVIGLLMRPWAAADSLFTILTFFGSILAPASGIVICDYLFLRKRKLSLYDLYHYDGEYKYWHNVNPAALIAFVAGILISMPFIDYIFFVGLFSSAAIYYVLMKVWIVKKYPQKDMETGSGE